MKTQTRRIHTRKLDRMVAKNNIKKHGGNLHDIIKSGLFAKSWRIYAGKEA